MAEFDKAKYWENRKKGVRGQGVVPPLPPAPERLKDKNGAYISAERERTMKAKGEL